MIRESTDMVERVARAICQQSGYDPDGPVGDYSAQWECFRASAEAALEASHHAELVGAVRPLVASLNNMEARLSELTLASNASDDDTLGIRIGDLRALRAVFSKIGEIK